MFFPISFLVRTERLSVLNAVQDAIFLFFSERTEQNLQLSLQYKLLANFSRTRIPYDVHYIVQKKILLT